ncbi:MAG: hypothetical protein ACRDOB_01565, partial [Streptosporangiaceae bacterium]
MTVRYHQRHGRDLPIYVCCQRDGIEHARRICRAIPGADLDERIGQLLIDTLTPLAVEAALTVTAELEHRATEADELRAAHVERARYHADRAPPLPRRRPRQPARRRHPRSRLEHHPPRAQRRASRLRPGPHPAQRAAHHRPEDPDR